MFNMLVDQICLLHNRKRLDSQMQQNILQRAWLIDLPIDHEQTTSLSCIINI